MKLQIFQRYFSTTCASTSLLGLEIQPRIQESIYLTKHTSNPFIFSSSLQRPTPPPRPTDTKIWHELKRLAKSSPGRTGLEVCGFPQWRWLLDLMSSSLHFAFPALPAWWEVHVQDNFNTAQLVSPLETSSFDVNRIVLQKNTRVCRWQQGSLLQLSNQANIPQLCSEIKQRCKQRSQ